jgi:hypothetical protein
MANIHCGCDEAKDLNRRDLLKLSGKGIVLGAMGMSMPGLLNRREAFALTPENPFYDGVLTVFFQGGPSHTDTWDPKPGSNNNVFNTINLGIKDVDNEDIHISEVFPGIANKVMNDPLVGLGILRAFWHGSNNHGNGQMMMGSWWRGQLGNSYPSAAPVMAEYFQGQGIGIPSVVIQGNNPDGVNDTRGARVPTALSVGTNNGQGGNPTVEALNLPPSVDLARYQRRKTLMDCLNQRFLDNHPDGMALAYQKATDDAYEVTRQGDAAQAFDLTGKPRLPAANAAVADRFTLAQELLKAGIPYVTMGIGGNDSHGNNMQTIQNNWGNNFDTAVTAMIDNLLTTRPGKRYLILAYGDFGRTPGTVANGRNGRDHWGDCFAPAMISVGQAKFKTNAYGQTGPDGLFTVNQNGGGGMPGTALNRTEPKDLGGFVYRAMGIPLFAADGRADIPTPLGRNAPPVERTGNVSSTLMTTFGLV